MIIALAASMVVIPILGVLSDKISFEIQFILAFGIRLSAALSFFLLNDPNTKFAKFIAILLVVSNYAEHTVTDSFFLKRIPGDVRGSLRGVVHAIALLFTFIFHIISAKLVENGFSPSTPIMIIAALDALVFYVAFVVGIFELHPDLNRFSFHEKQTEIESPTSADKASDVVQTKDEAKTNKK